MNPLAQHCLKILSNEYKLDAVALPLFVTAAGSITLAIFKRWHDKLSDLNKANDTKHRSFEIKTDPSSQEESLTFLALSTLDTSHADQKEEHLSLEGVEEFYSIKKEQEILVPNLRIDAHNTTKELKEKIESLSKPIENVFLQKSTISDPRLKTTAVPSDKGLLLMSAYYQKKYAIDILVVSDLQSAKNAVLGQFLPKNVTQWGVIVTNGDGSSHVTPLLCVKNKEGIIQVFDLDSVINPTKTVFNMFFSLFEEGKGGLFTVLRLIDPRQADDYSCRTDALVILKDALCDLKQQHVQDLLMFLKPHVTDNGQKMFFELPPSWGKTVQVSNALRGAADQTLLAGTKARTLNEFKKRYKTTTLKEDRFIISYRDDEGNYLRSIKFDVKKLISVNRFLNYKGKKKLELVRKLVKEQDPDLMQRYRHLTKTYATGSL